MNLLVAIIITAVLCGGSFFLGMRSEAARLEEIKALIHEETLKALAESKQESLRVEKEYHDKLDKLQAQWDTQINPLLNVSQQKCGNSGKSSKACMKANNQVLEKLFGIEQSQQDILKP